MPFGFWARIGPRNHVLDGVQIPMDRGNFEGERAAHCKIYEYSAVSCTKTAEPIEMPFALWVPMGPRIYILDGGSDPPVGRGNVEG